MLGEAEVDEASSGLQGMSAVWLHQRSVFFNGPDLPHNVVAGDEAAENPIQVR
jgi:hypothetical protein